MQIALGLGFSLSIIRMPRVAGSPCLNMMRQIEEPLVIGVKLQHDMWCLGSLLTNTSQAMQEFFEFFELLQALSKAHGHFV